MKSLEGFLKYQMFFADADYDDKRYQSQQGPRYVGNGIMGAMKHSYQMRLVLTQLVSQDTFDYNKANFPQIVGGYVLRKTMSEEELYTVAGFGFHLLSQKPGTGKPNLCGQSMKEREQVIYEVEEYGSGEIKKIGLPCLAYEESYTSYYKILAGTWLGKKKRIN